MARVRAQRPSIELHVEVETVDGGIHRWDAKDLTPGNRPLNVSWRTQRGDGFADGSLSLNRDILRDWPDLNLVDTVRIIGADGQVRYEGRNVNAGRESGDNGSQFAIQLAGWMSHAKDRRMREIYVDRDTSHFTGEIPTARRLALIAGGMKFRASGSVEATSQSAAPAVRLSHTRLNDTATYRSVIEAWYYANGIPIGSIAGDYLDKDSSTNAALSGWSVFALLSSDDALSTYDASSALAGTTNPWSVAATTDRRYAVLQMLYMGTVGAYDGEWSAYLKNPYAVGTHGLALSGGGLTASQIIRDSAQRFCPQLDTSGIVDTTYPIRHCAPIDPVYPFDLWLQVNAAHLWELAVFEDRKLLYTAPASLDDFDWQVRTDDPGVRITYGGTALADLGNGVEVSFDDLDSGARKLITPNDYSDLADPDPNNPITRAGIQKWLTYDVPFPTLEADAVQYGRMYLQEAIRAKSPATITTGFWVRDRAGAWQPASKVRCGERIAITDHPNDAPRRIIDTGYAHDGRGLTISADRASTRMSAITDRISLARTAAGL